MQRRAFETGALAVDQSEAAALAVDQSEPGARPGWPTSFGGGGGDDRGRVGSPNRGRSAISANMPRHDCERISSSPPCPKDMGHPGGQSEPGARPGWPTSFGGGGGDDRGRVGSPNRGRSAISANMPRHDCERISSSPPCPKDMGHPGHNKTYWCHVVAHVHDYLLHAGHTRRQEGVGP
jgi:hypothetical protein